MRNPAPNDYCFEVTFHSDGWFLHFSSRFLFLSAREHRGRMSLGVWKSRPLAQGKAPRFLFPASQPELDKVFWMPEGYRHDIQHGNQCGPQRLPDIAIACLMLPSYQGYCSRFECNVNEKHQCSVWTHWGGPVKREQGLSGTSLNHHSYFFTFGIRCHDCHDSILSVPDKIPHKSFLFRWPFWKSWGWPTSTRISQLEPLSGSKGRFE